MPGVDVVYKYVSVFRYSAVGRVTLTAATWEDICEKLVKLSQNLVIIGQNIPPDYLLFLNEFASHPDVQTFTPRVQVLNSASYRF